MLPLLRNADPFPPVEKALDKFGGVLAVGADLSPERLLDAYSRGIFPWYWREEPIMWWSPNPRMVLRVEDFVLSKSLARRMRNGGFEVRVNTAFGDVMAHCANTPRDGQDGTWIQPEMIAAYTRLHQLGYAHSVETWHAGALVGGLYGIAIDRMFFGESMFAHKSDASKVALAHLVAVLRAADMPLIDCQQKTAHLASLGARPIPRAAFLAQLRGLISTIRPSAIKQR